MPFPIRELSYGSAGRVCAAAMRACAHQPLVGSPLPGQGAVAPDVWPTLSRWPGNRFRDPAGAPARPEDRPSLSPQDRAARVFSMVRLDASARVVASTTACSPARFARAAPRVAPRAWGESPRRQRHASPRSGSGLGPIGPWSICGARRCSPGARGSRQPPAHVRFVLLRGLCLTGAAVSQGTCALFCPCEWYPSPGTGYVMDTS